MEAELAKTLSAIAELESAAAEEGTPPPEAELPDGWSLSLSKGTGKPYYFNTRTGVSTYERPTASTEDPSGLSLEPASDQDESSVQLDPAMLQRVFSSDAREVQQRVAEASRAVSALQTKVASEHDMLSAARRILADLQQAKDAAAQELHQFLYSHQLL